MVKSAVVLLAVVACSASYASASEPRSLTLAERDRVGEAIERVDGRHRIGAAEMAALEAYWKLTLTDDMLESELGRLARESRPPERLLEIYAALGDDSFLIKECLARPSLVERLSRDLFAFDPMLHAAARAEAEGLRHRLLVGELSPWTDRPGRSVFERAPRESEVVGQVSTLEEERDGFVFSVILSATTREVRVARYVVAKTSFASWWATVKQPPPGASIAAVAREHGPSPLPVRSPDLSLTCADTQQTVDLSVTSSVAPDPVAVGDPLTYTIVMQNAGPDSAVDAEMLDLPPEGTTYQSIAWSAPDGAWVCTVPPVGVHGKISCTNKCFAPGSSVTFTITTQVEPCVGSIDLTGTTIASSASSDSDPQNDAADARTTVIDPGTCDDGSVCTENDQCAPGLGFSENFDLVETPAIPPGWTATLVLGPSGRGSWATTNFPFDTPPNSVFMPDTPIVTDSVLDSPEIPIQSPTAQLRFRNRYDLEKDDDGAVLEIKIGNEPFQDILFAGGSFVAGGYTGTISVSFGSPIGGREAWTGAANQFILTTVNLPAAAAGKMIVLRWRLATDLTRGNVGQWIDSVAVTGRNRCQPGTPVVCDDSDACTVDSCDGTTGCVHDPISCDDGKFCTDDACDPSLGCVHTNTTSACDDSNRCTQTDVCTSGVCVGSNPLVCQDNDTCTADSCDPAIGCVAATANIDTTGFSASRVDGRDLAVLARSWNSCPNNLRYNAAANLDPQEPCINEVDFHLFMNAFGRDCAP